MNLLEDNIMDNTNKKELLNRIKAEELNDDKVLFTNVNTVVFIESDGSYSKERTFSDFINALRKEIKDNDSVVKYDKEENKFFYINENDYAYEFDIPKEDMINYALGKYNKITSALNDLYLESMSVDEKEKLEKEKKEEEKRIVKKAEGTKEELTPIEARIYLDYLKDLKRTNAKIIRKKAVKSTLATLPPFLVGTGVYRLITHPAALEANDITTATGIIIAKFVAGAFGVSFGFLAAVGQSEFFGSFDDFITIKEIKKEHKERKLINTKIKSLSQIKNIDKIVPAKACSVEENDETDEQLKPLNLKNSTMNSIDNLLNRINLLNDKDKMAFLKETQSVLSDYTERYLEIAGRDQNAINIDLESYSELKDEMFRKITDLELRIDEVREKDKEIRDFTSESRLLTDKIEGFTEFNNFENELKKVHDNTMQKVKVKTLKENKKGIEKRIS
jgi:hypothetical protein